MRLYEIPRTQDEVYINDYNPLLLSLFRGNVDIQFIGDSSGLVCEYVCKYHVKAEKAHLQWDFEKSAHSACQSLWRIGLKALQSREVGTIEAADTLLGHFLVKTDRKTVFRYVNPKYAKNRRLKTKKQMEEEPDDSTDIYLPDNVDDRYVNRPDEMEEVSLKDFVAKYDNATPTDLKKNDQKQNLIKLKKDVGFMKPRSVPALVSHCIPDKLKNSEEYFQIFLLLFKPWRNRNDVLGRF